MTTKEQILEEIKDINYAYNNCSKYATIKNLLDEMAEERKTGKWIKRGESLYRCSECGRFHTAQENYCPNCGADMRGETDDKN